ncbi:uncharacterized protein LOC106093128 [Stomoxys calcitrans]|uniref:Uncharacterized protein n=1 Tax=Stomoxys calcitrans TaxID=35570 RepID=A0A1I8PD12_STOCA|nr:uncharacterized protein LOC106093128 [Stomoxys calcitrans]
MDHFLVFRLSLVFILVNSFLVVRALRETTTTDNLKAFRRHRERRGLVFTNGGIIKLSIGPSIQVALADPVPFRSLVYSFNVQGGQYTIPTEPLYPWDKWENTFARSLKQIKSRFEDWGENKDDGSREFLYTVLEDYMARNNANGHQCLLRAICQNAQVQRHEGIFAQLLDVILTPGHENLDKSYVMAMQAGRYGVDCLTMYYLCPTGSSPLDQYINEI